jgi:hypothetical protein
LTITGKNAHNWVGFNCDGRTNATSFRRRIIIIFSADNIVTMAKRFKTIKEVDLEEPRSGNGRAAQRCEV